MEVFLEQGNSKQNLAENPAMGWKSAPTRNNNTAVLGRLHGAYRNQRVSNKLTIIFLPREISVPTKENEGITPLKKASVREVSIRDGNDLGRKYKTRRNACQIPTIVYY